MTTFRRLVWAMAGFMIPLIFILAPFIIIGLALKNAEITIYHKPAVGNVNAMVSASVMIEATGGVGSGVAFRNGKDVFVWTAAHVVAGARKNADVLGKDGSVRQVSTFSDVLLSQELFQDGRKGGFESVYAKVIRYSDRQDLCLLKTRVAWPKGSVRFAGDAEAVVGSPIWHVGSMSGSRGCNSLTEGLMSAIGRLRIGGSPEEVQSSDVYDQVALTAHPGSSGGGVFLKASSAPCIGLVIEFLGPGKLPGVLCIAPVRRMREFARDANCQWAMSAEVPVPDFDDEPVVQDAIEVVKVP